MNLKKVKETAKDYVLDLWMDHKNIIEAINKNDGYCPCMIAKNQYTVCPCLPLRSHKNCICGLYVKKKD